MAFIDGAADLEDWPLDRLKLSSESLRAPMSLQVEPTAAGLVDTGKALPVCGNDGGPCGANIEPAPPDIGCIIPAGGRDVMDRPSSRSTELAD